MNTCVVYSAVESPAVFQLWAYFIVSVRTHAGNTDEGQGAK